MRKQTVGSLTSFMEMITYEYLIQSIQFIITSIIRGSKPEVLLAKCHPLGKSPQLKQILTFENDLGEDDGLLSLYKTVLVDTPVAKYFALYFNSELGADQQVREIKRHYDEQEVEIITNMLVKLWLEDFYAYTQNLGGETARIMKELLEFEADRRAIDITINSLRTSLNDDINRHGRQDLYCSFGKLYPNGTLKEFPKIKLITELGDKLKPYKVYYDMWKAAETDPSRYGGGDAPLEENIAERKGHSESEQWLKWSPIIESFTDMMKRYHVDLCRKAFEGQSHYAGFYAYIKLKQHEEDNLRWILAMIGMQRGAKDRARWVKTF
jgi:V-type H+-transporting ATPase subunit d